MNPKTKEKVFFIVFFGAIILIISGLIAVGWFAGRASVNYEESPIQGKMVCIGENTCTDKGIEEADKVIDIRCNEVANIEATDESTTQVKQWATLVCTSIYGE